ncbi:MAG: hypothetical protein ABEJ65_02715 [bacterium]
MELSRYYGHGDRKPLVTVIGYLKKGYPVNGGLPYLIVADMVEGKSDSAR